MILYINFYSLSRFERLYQDREDLQIMVERWTGIKWRVNEGYEDSIRKLLIGKGIKYDLVPYEMN